jgi:D-amino-acid dehydrogenase
MSDTSFDVLVLGAGMVGTSIAAHVAGRGVTVALVDRQAPGEGTSFGNCGIIDSAAFMPSPFPRALASLVPMALGRKAHLNYRPSFLPRIADWLYAYWRESTPERVAASAARMAPLASLAVKEHDALAQAAEATHLIRHTGWMHLYRSKEGFAAEEGDHDLMRRWGATVDIVEGDALAALEPHLSPVVTKAAWIRDAASTSNPGALTKAYAALAERRGARLLNGDARGLVRRADGWGLLTETGPITARQVVVALGPWAKELLAGFGVDVPITVKRGYHMHYKLTGNAVLNRPVADVEGGYAITPMEMGTRLTTGAEFDDRDAPPTPVQVGRAEERVREILPLGERLQAEPWMGRRPNTPDSGPIIGRAPNVPDMWLAVGHGHWGLALGPATGRLLADLVTGGTPVVDPAPLGLERFR